MTEKITEDQYLDALQLIRSYFKQIEGEIPRLDYKNNGAILKRRLSSFSFSTRLMSIFDFHSEMKYIDGIQIWTSKPIQTVSDLVFYNKLYYQKLRGCGACSINEILDFMDDNNLLFENRYKIK